MTDEPLTDLTHLVETERWPRQSGWARLMGGLLTVLQLVVWGMIAAIMLWAALVSLGMGAKLGVAALMAGWAWAAKLFGL